MSRSLYNYIIHPEPDSAVLEPYDGRVQEVMNDPKRKYTNTTLFTSLLRPALMDKVAEMLEGHFRSLDHHVLLMTGPDRGLFEFSKGGTTQEATFIWTPSYKVEVWNPASPSLNDEDYNKYTGAILKVMSGHILKQDAA